MAKHLVDFEKLLVLLEKQVVQGEHHEAKRLIKELNLNLIPRSSAAPVAGVACRISEPLLTLKILNKFVFPENELQPRATDSEKLIYATALGNLGAVDEALVIFDSVSNPNEPEVLLRKSMAHFRAWNYPAAIPSLDKFLEQKDLPTYRRLIGQVNLAAALVMDCKFSKAQHLLQEIQMQCLEKNYLLLLGNSYELEAQNYFFQQNYTKALDLLDKAIELLKNQGGEFHLFAEKWQHISRAFLKKDAESLQALKAFNKKALSSGQWESSRECDLFEAVLTEDENLARKVVLGTPFEYYRQRARKLCGKNIPAQGHFYWQLGDHHSSVAAKVFSPYKTESGNEGLYTKPHLLALFEALSQDFYKPSHIGLLFQRIYKVEKFNPFTSPQRVLSLIKRLNLWFIEKDIDLRVQMKKSEFALIAHNNQPIKIFIQRAKSLSKQEGQFSFLRDFFKDRTFSSQHVAEKMNISRSSAQNLIAQALEQGYVAKNGVGRGTTYSLLSRNKKRQAA